MASKYSKVFKLFNKNYSKIPLEVFKDPYKILISTLLSSRTKDEVTLDASKRLFKKAPSIKRLNQLGQLEIRILIFPVGFYKTKAKHLKSLAKTLTTKFNSKVPLSRSDLESLPGVKCGGGR